MLVLVAINMKRKTAEESGCSDYTESNAMPAVL